MRKIDDITELKLTRRCDLWGAPYPFYEKGFVNCFACYLLSLKLYLSTSMGVVLKKKWGDGVGEGWGMGEGGEPDTWLPDYETSLETVINRSFHTKK